MSKVIAYLRVSTESQAESGAGLSADKASILRHCHGIAPDLEFVDTACGADATRPGLLAALDALSDGDRLVAAKPDRIARDVYLSAWVKKEVKKKGATIEFAEGGVSGDTPEGRLLGNIIDCFAMYEREIICWRTRRALEQRKAAGTILGRIPYGYQAVGEGRDRRLVTVHCEQWVTVCLLALAQHGFNDATVAKFLTANGIVSPGGKRWDSWAVRRVRVRISQKFGDS